MRAAVDVLIRMPCLARATTSPFACTFPFGSYGMFRTRKELERIRGSGYAVDDREHQPDVRCVTAPIRNYTGKVIASLSVSGPATRIQKEGIPPLATRVCEVAGKLSFRLGYRPEGEDREQGRK